MSEEVVEMAYDAEQGDEGFDDDDGLQGWPDPSAVECIRDDVCRLCLTNPGLDEMIARCVSERWLEFVQ